MKVRKRIRPGAPVRWIADLGIVDGKRVQWTCKTEAEAKALIVTKKKEREKEGEAVLTLSNSVKMRFLNAQKTLEAVGVTIEEAVAFYMRHVRPAANSISFRDLVARCVEDKLAQRRSDKYADALKRLGDSFEKKGGHTGKLAREITTEDIARFLQGNGWSPKTQTIYATDLSSLFAWGVKKKLLSFNPVDDFNRPRLDDRAPEIFTVEECQRLMDAALATQEEPPEVVQALYAATAGKSKHAPKSPRRVEALELLPYIAVCLFAGVRMEECEKLTWENINLAERFVEIPAAVAKRVRGVRRRVIPMSDNLAAWLECVRIKEGPLAPKGKQKRMRALRVEAKLERWPNRVLRHSFASYHLAKHRNAEQTRLDMGHDDTEMLFTHYREVVRPKDADAFWNLKPHVLFK